MRKAYAAPFLVWLGTVVQLTKGTVTHTGLLSFWGVRQRRQTPSTIRAISAGVPPVEAPPLSQRLHTRMKE